MKIRKNILPRNLAELCSIAFILFMIPIVYYFEIFIVLPQLYDSSSSIWYFIHLVCGTFTMINVISNYSATVLIETSVKKNIDVVPDSVFERCSVCNIPAPPRSWHCRRCDDCVLKRDHHCIFVGSCIGHFNHRFFIWLLFFLFVGTLHSSYLNIFFVRKNFNYKPFHFLKVVFPLLFVLYGFDEKVDHSTLILIVITFIAMLITGGLLYFHSKLVLYGTTCKEYSRKDFSYYISTKENIRRVLGERWYLTWISAFIESKLHEEGDCWNPNFLMASKKHS